MLLSGAAWALMHLLLCACKQSSPARHVHACRSARMGDEIGGHHVSGHVHTTATITSIRQTDNNRQITMRVRHFHSMHLMERLSGLESAHKAPLRFTLSQCAAGLLNLRLLGCSILHLFATKLWLSWLGESACLFHYYPFRSLNCSPQRAAADKGRHLAFSLAAFEVAAGKTLVPRRGLSWDSQCP